MSKLMSKQGAHSRYLLQLVQVDHGTGRAKVRETIPKPSSRDVGHTQARRYLEQIYRRLRKAAECYDYNLGCELVEILHNMTPPDPCSQLYSRRQSAPATVTL